VADLVERCCHLARRFAAGLDELDGVEVGNDVVLNQVLVRFGDDDAVTDHIVAEAQREGTCWMGGTTWRGRRYMRLSVSNWQTTEVDIDRSILAIARIAAAATSDFTLKWVLSARENGADVSGRRAPTRRSDQGPPTHAEPDSEPAWCPETPGRATLTGTCGMASPDVP
jgi:hypothetical protein